MRILFVGQAPSRETDGQPPFTGRCGVFLASMLDLSQEQMLAAHDFINVLDYYPGKGLGGDKFPPKEAKQAAREKAKQLRNRTTVLLGGNVARAFGASGFAYLSWYEFRDPANPTDVVTKRLTVVPHPSGVNRYYNNPRSREAVTKFLQQLAAKPE